MSDLSRIEAFSFCSQTLVKKKEQGVMSHRAKCKRVHGHGKALTNLNTDSTSEILKRE